MNAVQDTVRHLVEPSELTVLISHLAYDSMTDAVAFDLIIELYRMAAAGEWRPVLTDLEVLVYAPLGNPPLIHAVASHVETILRSNPLDYQLNIGWQYVLACVAAQAAERSWAGGSR